MVSIWCMLYYIYLFLSFWTGASYTDSKWSIIQNISFLIIHIINYKSRPLNYLRMVLHSCVTRIEKNLYEKRFADDVQMVQLDICWQHFCMYCLLIIRKFCSKCKRVISDQNVNTSIYEGEGALSGPPYCTFLPLTHVAWTLNNYIKIQVVISLFTENLLFS